MEPADRVRPEDELHFVPVDRDVGMMTLLFRQSRDAVDELHRLDEVSKLETPEQAPRSVRHRPARHGVVEPAGLLFGEGRSALAAGHAVLRGEIRRLHDVIVTAGPGMCWLGGRGSNPEILPTWSKPHK